MSGLKLGVVMDPIQHIKVAKDSTFALLLAAQKRGWQLFYLEPHALWLENGVAWGDMKPLQVADDPAQWFHLASASPYPLHELDVLLMRKDPPFTIDYIYLTYLLELAEKRGVLVVNRPSALRDVNEKLFTAWFPQCCPPTLVSRDKQRIKEFLHTHSDIICKPLDQMGGESIFRITKGDVNTNVILETMTHHGRRFIMAQRYLPEIKEGDKRVLLIDGTPIPYALARLPGPQDHRANLAVGGKGRGQALTKHDRWICQQVGDTLRQKGLLFVGLDIIGNYLTEINVTSPTGIRELEAQFGLDISGQIMDHIANRVRR